MFERPSVSKPSPLYPISPHPETLAPLPILPSAPRPQAFNERYTLSTHIIPAAFPRVAPSVLPLEPIPAWRTKEEMDRVSLEQTLELVRMHDEVREVGKSCHSAVLWNCVNRYLLRKDIASSASAASESAGKGKGLTLFLAHPSGFPKEARIPLFYK